MTAQTAPPPSSGSPPSPEAVPRSPDRGEVDTQGALSARGTGDPPGTQPEPTRPHPHCCPWGDPPTGGPPLLGLVHGDPYSESPWVPGNHISHPDATSSPCWMDEATGFVSRLQPGVSPLMQPGGIRRHYPVCLKRLLVQPHLVPRRVFCNQPLPTANTVPLCNLSRGLSTSSLPMAWISGAVPHTGQQ